jgi:methionyl aminopeptidase
VADLEVSARSRPGRNDPCWCGSGQKYKKCHLDADRRGEGGPPARRGRPPLHPGIVTPRRAVPPGIIRPDYAASGRPKVQGSDVKTAEQLERLRRACRAAARVLRVTGEAVRAGITTDALDELAHAETIRLGGYPSPLNYRGFPKSLCTSVNEVICHGIPDSRPLDDGDIVNLDVTVYLDGMHGDCSATFLVGDVDPEGRRLVQVARECLAKGVDAVRPGRPISDIGKAIEAHASLHGYGVVRAYCGHGIGESFHTALQVPHHFDPSVKRKMEPGMTFTVEPMITEGSWEDALWADGWTAVTQDGKRSAQFEHTLAVTGSGADILTVEGERPAP